MSKIDKSRLRKILMIGGVVAVLAGGGIFYLFSGRYADTDNAYVKSDIVMISPQVTGPIIESTIADNSQVKAGDVLFKIDPAPFKIALDMATANLDLARTQVEQLKSQYLQKNDAIGAAGAEVVYAEREYNRSKSLGTAVSKSQLDETWKNYSSAKDKLSQLQQEQAEILAGLDGDPNIKVEDHPRYQAALAARDKAQLDLDHTVVKAPFDGIVPSAPKAGDYARASAPSMSVVKTGDLWIEANYKETDLERMKPGQQASIRIDTYPHHRWTGRVESVSPASGSEFSILPAQNSTGNWVKVVQRIPVRIAVDQKAGDPPLRAGMSTEVTVDTGSYPHLSANAADQP